MSDDEYNSIITEIPSNIKSVAKFENIEAEIFEEIIVETINESELDGDLLQGSLD